MWVAFHLPADSQEHTTSQNMVQNLRPATQRFWTLGSETIHSKWSQWHCRPKPKSISWFLDSSPKKKESSLFIIPKALCFPWRSSEKSSLLQRLRGQQEDSGDPFLWKQVLHLQRRRNGSSPVNGLVFLGKSSPGTMDFPMKHGGGPEVSLCFTRMVGKKIRVMISFPQYQTCPKQPW